ncbi:beta-2-glycoprotein 1-like [Osmerus eperlanus]|uniref:beta-2-glycoprotein 1-like n=1 Tax=Osmerus eperlanus TaxID=29151 RepID=UPI002E0E2CB3
MAQALRLFLLLLFQFAFQSATSNVCGRPVLDEHIQIKDLQRIFNPGKQMALMCERGYSPTDGARTIICRDSGSWSKTMFSCKPNYCPIPSPLLHGETIFTDRKYMSKLEYVCNEGYTLEGTDSSECLYNGRWNGSAPECKPVTCGLPPIPKYAQLTYEMIFTDNPSVYGDVVSYQCLPPLALFGSKTATCTHQGVWSEPPVCRLVSCPPPPSISNGYMSASILTKHYFKETVRYDCDPGYTLEGVFEIECAQSGQWTSEPTCKAPCNVGVDRGRILYQGEKLWLQNLKDNRVLHKDMVSFYCMNKKDECGYAVPIQCIDGKLNIPECFEEPSVEVYKEKSSSLPSEIKQC